ncbi:MAG: hypothetical protein AMDU4_FER2C00118G0023 [Ferroplasma sp. Type II]|jgi:hypothetical protein|uniref:ATP-binding protein n=1 Tax=Ferroplasma sp. Type II TaxID=261388 RepID=UPI0003896FCF|nr:ATP-binding protein [Ferroplasma sp. Type II]EQB72931.1 MAG: hypothetical protein AMDU4_FER2C00118G0023 [Ferroplasma sp. Type II]
MSCGFLSGFQIQDNFVTDPKEGINYEFKESFSWGSKEQYAKIMSSFANSSGGCLIFGIKDDGYIIGLNNNNFENKDSAEISSYLNSVFSPAIAWNKSVCECNGKKIGVIQVREAVDKPIISHKNVQEIKESDIFYRYTAQTGKIRHPELKSIIEVEKRKYGEKLLNSLKMIVEKGPETVKLLDLGELEGAKEDTVYLIDAKSSDLEVKVHEASEGEKAEGIGLKIVKIEGKAIPVTVTEFANISSELIIHSFLEQELPSSYNPKGFIERLPYETSGLVPIYFYITKAGMSMDEAVGIIRNAKSTTRGRSTLINRLTKKEYDFRTHTNSYSLKQLIEGEIKIEEVKRSNVKYTLRAIRSESKDYLLQNWGIIKMIVRYAYDNFYMDPGMRQDLRLAICFMDKTLYSKGDEFTNT